LRQFKKRECVGATSLSLGQNLLPVENRVPRKGVISSVEVAVDGIEVERHYVTSA